MVVDNASVDGLLWLIRQDYPSVKLIVSDVNGVVDARTYATSPGNVSFSVPAGTVAAAAQGGGMGGGGMGGDFDY